MYPLGDSHDLKVDRGNEMIVRAIPVKKEITTVQIKAATREEMKKIADLAVKVLVIANRYADNMLRAERSMLMDKVNNFENAHRNWRKYPQDERKKIVMIMSAADSACDRSYVVHSVLNSTRKALRAVERYIEMSLHRLK